MKSLILLLVFLGMMSLSSIAQVPTYTLSATDGWWDPNEPRHFDFEFQITWTNSGVAPNFEYAGGQYFMDINPEVANGGTLSMSKISSDLPVNMHPRNPTVFTGSTPWQLRWAVNTFPGAGNGFPFPASVPIEIVRFKVETTASTLSQNFLVFPVEWRNASPNPFTKIFAYVGTTNTDISTPGTHTAFLWWEPVELISFTSKVERNRVSLLWETSMEENNRGFDVERKILNTDEWKQIGFVNGNGTTNEMKTYSFVDRANTGIYDYRLKQIDYNGNYKYYLLADQVSVGIPTEFNLSQNYPNPFNPSTKIDYDLTVGGNISLSIFDMSGRLIAELINEDKDAGYYTIQFQAASLSSGAYFYRLVANGFVQTKKMMVLK